ALALLVAPHPDRVHALQRVARLLGLDARLVERVVGSAVRQGGDRGTRAFLEAALQRTPRAGEFGRAACEQLLQQAGMDFVLAHGAERAAQAVERAAG